MLCDNNEASEVSIWIRKDHLSLRSNYIEYNQQASPNKQTTNQPPTTTYIHPLQASANLFSVSISHIASLAITQTRPSIGGKTTKGMSTLQQQQKLMVKWVLEAGSGAWALKLSKRGGRVSHSHSKQGNQLLWFDMEDCYFLSAREFYSALSPDSMQAGWRMCTGSGFTFSFLPPTPVPFLLFSNIF